MRLLMAFKPNACLQLMFCALFASPEHSIGRLNTWPAALQVRCADLFPALFSCRYDGQEAVMTGIEAALTREDAVITSYRDHCQHISRGGTVKEVMAELMGKKDGASRGLGGSMHM